MISKGEKEKQRKDLNKFIEQNVQGINKIGLHKKGGGGRISFMNDQMKE